jgi:hypothetical protein
MLCCITCMHLYISATFLLYDIRTCVREYIVVGCIHKKFQTNTYTQDTQTKFQVMQRQGQEDIVPADDCVCKSSIFAHQRGHLMPCLDMISLNTPFYRMIQVRLHLPPTPPPKIQTHANIHAYTLQGC